MKLSHTFSSQPSPCCNLNTEIHSFLIRVLKNNYPMSLESEALARNERQNLRDASLHYRSVQHDNGTFYFLDVLIYIK
jgi:hypothetical protein